MSPPYDVISEADQELYYDMSPFNIVRLILGREFPDDHEHNNRYTRARDFLTHWRRDGIFVTDDEPSFYGYSQTFKTASGERLTRNGFVGAVKIEEFGKGDIFPHEKTYDAPKSDRLNLLRATRTQMSTVFMLFSDPEGKSRKEIERVLGGSELCRFTDRDGVEHALTRVTDPALHKTISKMMADKKIIIADGHHRYETAVNFRDEMERAGAMGDGHRYVMAYLSPMEDPGVCVLPTHRVVSLPDGFDRGSFLKKLENFFTVTVIAPDDRGAFVLIEALEKSGNKHFGLAFGDTMYYLFGLADACGIAGFFPSGMADTIKSLDVSILHHVIIDNLLGIEEPKIVYTKDPAIASSMIKGEKAVAFFLNPTDIDDVKRVSFSGERMPQKSTYFYPKVYSGLVLYRVIP